MLRVALNPCGYCAMIKRRVSPLYQLSVGFTLIYATSIRKILCKYFGVEHRKNGMKVSKCPNQDIPIKHSLKVHLLAFLH